MAISKYLRKVKTAVSESAHNNGLKRVKQNEVKKEWEKICEPQPKKERQSYGNYEKLKQGEISMWGIIYNIRPTAMEIWHFWTYSMWKKNYKEAKLRLTSELNESYFKGRKYKASRLWCQLQQCNCNC